MSTPHDASYAPKKDLPFRETLVEEAQLSECDRINLEFLGSIQGDSANVAFITYPDCKVVAMDERFKTLSFMTAKNELAILGKSVQELFPEKLSSKIIEGVEAMSKAKLLREFVFAWEGETYYSFCLSTNTPGDYSTIGIEIEALDDVSILDVAASQKELANTLSSVGRALDFCAQGQDAAKIACNAIFKMLGHFERGMVYYFHDDLSGEVIHEIKKDSVKSSYMGMHFPKADIPQSARLLYVKNVVRYIRYVDGEDVQIVGNTKVDLTQTRSRCVHKCHLIYMRGMGVKSALSLAIVSGGELWGLLSFHGYTTPFKPSIHQLIACETIASCVSARVVARAHNVRNTRTLLLGQVFRKWDQEASVTKNLDTFGDQIVDLMEADVFAARYKVGETVESVAKGDMALLPRGLFWTKLSQKVPEGEMIVRSSRKSIQELGLTEKNCPGSDFLFTRGKDAEIMIGRNFRVRDVIWGGNPDAPKLNIGGLLHPRASFEAQIEKARKATHPFNTLEQKMAGFLGDKIFHKSAMSWALDLVDEDNDEDVLATFNALQSSGDDQVLTELNNYLQTLDHVKPKRLYLAPSKVKNVVAFDEFAPQSLSSLAPLAEQSNQELTINVDSTNQESFNHILVDHTELAQIAANITKVGMDYAGPMGSVEVNFMMQDSLKSAVDKFEADAAPHHALAFALKEHPVANWLGPVKELVAQEQEKENQKWFCFTVTDSGNGFELEQLEKMLQSHKQASKDINVTSTKLSLFLCVELCRRLGGFMACASTPYQGTLFHVGVPVDVLTKEKADARLTDDAVVGDPIIVSGPILIVGDDDLGVANQLLKQNNKLGLDVEIVKASNGEEAVAAFSGDITPSVMILDSKMSDVDGLDIMAQVRKIEYERNLLSCYIVSYTADVADNATTLLLKAGGNEVVVKPAPSDFVPNFARRFKLETPPALKEMMAV